MAQINEPYEIRAVFFSDDNNTESFSLSCVPKEYGAPDKFGIYRNLPDGRQEHMSDHPSLRAAVLKVNSLTK